MAACEPFLAISVPDLVPPFCSIAPFLRKGGGTEQTKIGPLFRALFRVEQLYLLGFPGFLFRPLFRLEQRHLVPSSGTLISLGFSAFCSSATLQTGTV
jgi:hypothetical protein